MSAVENNGSKKKIQATIARIIFTMMRQSRKIINLAKLINEIKCALLD